MKMPGYIVSTNAGYDVYIGSIWLADVSSFAEAMSALASCGLPWSGRLYRKVSPSRY